MKTKLDHHRPDPESLLQELTDVRRLSLEASRQNDFRRVARLTSEASRLNRAIQELEADHVLTCAL